MRYTGIDHDPFGMLLVGRTLGENYRNGFNTQEQDNEVNGYGNLTTALFWDYDTRIGRRWNRDVVITNLSPYCAFSNNPLVFIDPNGDDDYFNSKGELILRTNTSTNNIFIIKVSKEAFSAAHIIAKEKHDGDEVLVNEYLKSYGLPISRFIVGENETDWNYAMLLNIIEFYYYNDLTSTNPKDKVDFYLINPLIGALAATRGQNMDNYIFSTMFIGLDNNKIPILLSDANNLKNLLVHERVHVNADRNTCVNCLDAGRNNHLSVYFSQVQHETWENTTTEWKQYIINNIGQYIYEADIDDTNALTDEEQKLWANKFGSELGGVIIINPDYVDVTNPNYDESKNIPKYILKVE